MSKSSLEVVLLEDRSTPGGLTLIGKLLPLALNAVPPADPTSPPTSGGGNGGTVVVSPPPPVSPPVHGNT